MDLCCKECASPILKSYGTKAKLRSRIIIFEDNTPCIAKCVNCGAETPIPLKLDLTQLNPDSPKPRPISHYIVK